MSAPSQEGSAGGQDSPAPAKDDGKKAEKKRHRDNSPRPQNLPKGAFRRKILSLEYADILIAWDKSDWLKAQEKENPGRIEEVAIESDDEHVPTRAWKGWVHAAYREVYVVRRHASQDDEVHESPVIHHKCVICPLCGKDYVFNGSSSSLKAHTSTCAPKHKVDKPARAQPQGSQAGQQVVPRRHVSDINDLAIRWLAALGLSFSFLQHPATQAFLAAFARDGTHLRIDRASVRNHTVVVADRDEASLIGSIMRKTGQASLAADGGTINSRKLLGVAVGACRKAFFFRLHTVLSSHHMSVAKHLSGTYRGLTALFVWVLTICADNHGAMQNGCRKVAAAFGLLVTRCACHSTQLVVGDFDDVCPYIVQARRVLEFITQQLTAEIAAKLPKKVPTYCPTRWNSAYESLLVCFELRADLEKLLPDLASKSADNKVSSIWFAVKASMSLLEPFRWLTKIFETNETTHFDVFAGLVGIHGHLMNSGSESAKFVAILEHRIATNFSSEVMLCVIFATPGLISLIAEKDSKVAQFIVSVVVSVAAKATLNYHTIQALKRTQELRSTLASITAVIQEQANSWFVQSAFFETRILTTTDLFAAWSSQMILYGELALFLMAVIATLVSEASVERIFSHTKLVLHATRMRMGERPTAAQTYVKFNGVALDGTSDHHGASVSVHIPGPYKYLQQLPNDDWSRVVHISITMATAVQQKLHITGLMSFAKWKELPYPFDLNDDDNDVELMEEEGNGDSADTDSDEDELGGGGVD